tara:strand:+ start:176 stop:358 length:183 start_codon:yes stop_codon:yes gene_type:complete
VAWDNPIEKHDINKSIIVFSLTKFINSISVKKYFPPKTNKKPGNSEHRFRKEYKKNLFIK